ncbi:hypothetical protein FA15DRAFT_671079 [Coprinopsis marcescibilis]|uniref:Roadblock/LAMTOR2 domain-containing protein n=1 Tax=Coprinopsis marcescibilis TaxID=230819 RepID=A0A5C3KQJ5_COPMA|nr:hypothetical protein FA15DRAFT_671079 [Coprinopsis marcescibilis]
MSGTARTPFVAPTVGGSSIGNPHSQGAGTGNISGSFSNSPMSPELEQKLSLLSTHRSVLGYLLVTRGHQPSIIRNSGVVFEGESGRKYAAVVARIVESVQSGLDEVRRDDAVGAPGLAEPESDEIRFMRIRTKRHELMISPDEKYLLAVLHDPAS